MGAGVRASESLTLETGPGLLLFAKPADGCDPERFGSSGAWSAESGPPNQVNSRGSHASKRKWNKTVNKNRTSTLGSLGPVSWHGVPNCSTSWVYPSMASNFTLAAVFGFDPEHCLGAFLASNLGHFRLRPRTSSSPISESNFVFAPNTVFASFGFKCRLHRHFWLRLAISSSRIPASDFVFAGIQLRCSSSRPFTA